MSCKRPNFHFSVEEDKTLIEKVKEHPALYDMEHSLYRDMRLKDNIWIEIAESMRKPIADCKKRWKNMKDTYDRKHRDVTPTDQTPTDHKRGRKKWRLAKKLSFLRSLKSRRNGASNTSHSFSEDSTSEDNVEEEETYCLQPNELAITNVDVTPHSPINLPPKTIIKDLQNESRNRLDNFHDIKEEELSDSTYKHFVPEEDDVDLFFKSIAKSVRKLPPNFIAEVKLQTLALVANLESQMHQQRVDRFSTLSTPFSTHPANSSVESNIDCTMNQCFPIFSITRHTCNNTSKVKRLNSQNKRKLC